MLIQPKKKLKPIASGNFADSSMIAWTDQPLSCWKPEKEWKFKYKSWIKNLSTAVSPKLKQTQVNSLVNVCMLLLFLSL